jgi:hypothetical protein
MLSAFLIRHYVEKGGDSIVRRIGGRIGGRISIFWRVCSTAAKLMSCLARALADRAGEWKEIHRFVTEVISFVISLEFGGLKEWCWFELSEGKYRSRVYVEVIM